MHGYGVRLVGILAVIVAVVIVSGQQLRIDPAMSLIKPFNPDDWIALGNPFFTPNELVLTSKRRHGGPQRAAVWNPNPFPYQNQFNITLRTSISGSNGPKTAVGFALWLVEREDGAPIGELGPVYGSHDYFRGLGIVFDTIDDDNKRNNPAISAHYLNGTLPYTHHDDGLSRQLAGCVADYRRPNVLTQIVYDGSKLSVHVNMAGSLQLCLQKPLKMRTDRDWYLGISAETIASEHPQETQEIVSMEVSGVANWNQKPPAPRQQQQKQQVPPPPQQQQQQQQVPPPAWQEPPVSGDLTAGTLHDKIDQLMKATTSTALESQQAGEALKEVQTNVLQKIQQSTNSVMQQIRRVDQSLSQHVTGTSQTLQTLSKSIESTKASVDSGRVDNERRTNAIDAQIASLQETIKDMDAVVNRLSKSFQAQIAREIGKGTARLAAATSSGGSWNFWVFLILFQVIFVVFLLYRSMMNKKLDKLL
jgi:hypothetical protein